MAAMIAASSLGLVAISHGDTIFSENVGSPTGTTTLANYINGTAPATFQNKGTLTYAQGQQASPCDIRMTNSSNIAGASGAGNVWLTSTSGAYGFSIESINAAGFTDLQLSYLYRKDQPGSHATFSVDYWNGSAWITLANTAGNLFNEASNASAIWYAAKTLPLPAGAQINGLKIRFVKTGSTAIRLDDFKLTGTPAGGDVTPPTITTYSPANNATGVATNSNLVATFSENVVAGTGDIVITKTASSVVFETIPVGDPRVSISNNVVTIDPTGTLEGGTAYNVQIANGAFKDAANLSHTGITNATTWAFTTAVPDTGGPTVVSFTPANGATGVSVSAPLSITFNENIQLPLDFEPTHFVTIKDSSDNVVAAIDSGSFGPITVTNAVATIPLPANLAYSTTYHVEIDAGAFEDTSENGFAGFTGSSTWSFTTVAEPVVPIVTTSQNYTQNFATFTGSNSTDARPMLPLGWTVTATGGDYSYDGLFGGSTNSGGFRGGANVLGYLHTSNTGVLTETLTLKNGNATEITDLVVSYHGKGAGPNPVSARNPVFAVTVAGTNVTGLTYTTSDGDDVLRTANISGLSIAPGATFEITWTSDRGAGSGGSRTIGISQVEVSIGATPLPPAVTSTVPLATLGYDSAGYSATVLSEGSQPVTARGFVYSSTDTTPTLGEPGVTTITDAAVGADPYTATASGLTAATSYTVSAYATNSVGTSYSAPITFTTLPTPPTYTGLYEQPFDNFEGQLPAGWSAVSSGGSQSYVGAWGNTSSLAGFTGGEAEPGVLGYQHTGTTGTLTTTLKLFNGTGSTITSLPVAYLGRASRTTEGRSPEFVVTVNGVEASALAYSTLDNVDVPLSTTVTGLNIAPGELIVITWASERGAGSGSSKQIGLGEVVIGGDVTPPGNTYTTWAAANAGGQGPNADFDNDGVKNGVEYFFGATGSSVTANPPIIAGAVSFPRDATATNATGTVYTSPDLVTWTAVASNDANLDTTNPAIVKYTLPTGQGKLFVRLDVMVTAP